jgi:two-component system, LuxR family, sensor kinase FixL
MRELCDYQASSMSNPTLDQLTHLGRVAFAAALCGAFAHEINQPLTSILADTQAGLQLLMQPDADLTEIRAMLTDVIGLTRSDLILRHVAVSMELHPYLPLVLGDRVQQLQQVMPNLIVDACDAMSGVDARNRRIWVTTRFDRHRLEIACSVRDNGCGLAGRDLERIFQPFVSTKVEGMGMGLAICRSIVEAHGGRLWAEDPLNRGATLTFTTRIAS